jgi:hypothetical protein
MRDRLFFRLVDPLPSPTIVIREPIPEPTVPTKGPPDIGMILMARTAAHQLREALRGTAPTDPDVLRLAANLLEGRDVWGDQAARAAARNLRWIAENGAQPDPHWVQLAIDLLEDKV